VDLQDGPAESLFIGAGGVHCTVRDLVRFACFELAAAQGHDKLLEAKTAARWQQISAGARAEGRPIFGGTQALTAAILAEEFLNPLGISQYRLAKDISVPPRRINDIVRGQRAIAADTALRLARYFRTTERFWLNLQTRYDLEVEKDLLGSRLDREASVLGSGR
jgi:antitoxin HigA-1